MNAFDIEEIIGRRVWDSRGRPTVEAEIRLTGGAIGRAIAPAGASMGSGEAVDLRDGGKSFGGHDVRGAIAGLNDEIAPALAGHDVRDQATLDKSLIELDGQDNKGRLGGNALIAVSMAALQAAATAEKAPLWRYLSDDRPVRVPLPEIQIFGGGAHAARRVDVQDFMIVCPGAGSFAQALDWTAEVYLAAGRIMEERGLLQGVADEGGYWPAFDSNEEALDTLMQAIEGAGLTPDDQVAISLDIAASEFHRGGSYLLGLEQRELSTQELCAMLQSWLGRYPILSIEDPVDEADGAGMASFTAAAGDTCQIVGDDFLVTNAARVAQAAAGEQCNCVLIKPNQAGTISETKAALDAARKAGYATIVSARSGETEDTTIAHLAVGWDAGQFKVGSFTRSERMAKWNEMLRIEEALGADARFAGRAPLLQRPGR